MSTGLLIRQGKLWGGGGNKQLSCHCERSEAISKSEIASAPTALRNDDEKPTPHNDGRRGLPIGNLTSQFFANLYLNELDYFVKFGLRKRYYIRYMDDFLVFGNDKKALKDVKEKVRDFLKNRLALQLHEGKSQVYRTKNGIKFLGFRIYKDYRRLASDNVRRFKKRLKRFAYLFESGEISAKEISDSVRCWVAHSKYAGTGNLRRNIFNNLADNKLGSSLKNILLNDVKITQEAVMKKLRFLAITLIILTVSACAADGRHKGGSGSGYSMAEYAGRLDGGKQPPETP